jgi:hypothetical protein
MEGRGNLYQTLIFAAKDWLDEAGTIPADLGEFARTLGMAEDEVRSLFASPEDLLEGVIYHAVTLLNDALREGAVSSITDDPIVQLRAIANSYLCWAERNPALFRLLVAGLNEPLQQDSTLHRFTLSMRDLYHRKLSEAKRLGILAEDTDIDLATVMLHCVAKGGNMILLTRETDPWFAGNPRSSVELANGIFQKFMDDMVSANAPRSSKKTAKTRDT